MKSKYVKCCGIGILLVFFIFTQVYAAVNINKPEIKNEASKTIIVIPFSADSVVFSTNKYNHLVYVDIEDAVLVGAPKMTMPVSDSVVTKFIIAQYQSEPKTVRAVVTLQKWVPFDIKQEGKSLVINVENVEGGAAATTEQKEMKEEKKTEKKAISESKKAAITKPVEQKPAPFQAPALEPKPVSPPPQPIPVMEVKPAPHGLDTRVTLDFSNADLPGVIRILADKSGLNIVAGPEVSGKVTIHLVDVTVKEALDTILAVQGFTREETSPNVIRIVKMEKPFVAQLPAVPIEVQQVTLNYRKTSEMVMLIQTVMPKLTVVEWADGNAKIISGTGTLVISGPADEVKKAIKLIKKMDKPIKQVMIETRLINIDLDKIKDLGVDWNITKGNIIDSGIYSVGGQSMDQPGILSGGLLFGTISTLSWNISATLHAAEEHDAAEVLANPRILALNNKESEIKIVRDHPYVKWSYDAQTNTFIGTVTFEDRLQEGVTLTVTPQITDDGNVILHLIPTQRTHRGDLSFPSAGGAPATVIALIDQRSADATLMVKDGQTAVIGGLRKNEETSVNRKIPFLGDIPIAGSLFRSKTKSVLHSEMMLFVTPYILKDNTELTAEEKINYDRIELK